MLFVSGCDGHRDRETGAGTCSRRRAPMALAMGSASTSHERCRVDQREILLWRRMPILGICYEAQGRWKHSPTSTLLGNDNPDPETRQNPQSSQSVRSRVDVLLYPPSSCDTPRRVVRCHRLVLTSGLSRMRCDSHVRFLGGRRSNALLLPDAVHGVDVAGRVVLRRMVTRSKLFELIAKLPRCLIGMDACCGGHEWARRFAQFGHSVMLMSPVFVIPYRKGGKNDGNDAEAICEAVMRPNMRLFRSNLRSNRRY